MVIIVAHTTLDTMPIIKHYTRYVNQGRLMDVEITGFIKHWEWKGRNRGQNMRSRCSY